jgi:hypothetical protein
MNLLLGIVVGILLTIGTAFIADAYSETSNRGSQTSTPQRKRRPTKPTPSCYNASMGCCFECKQKFIEIDNRGEYLIGCLTCNVWCRGGLQTP